MKSIRFYQQPLALFLVLIMLSGTLGCFSRRQLQSTRLSKISLETLQFILVDPNAPATNMWLLSNVKTEETALSAAAERASPEFLKQFAALNKKGHRNHVLLYVNPELVKTYTDNFSTRLNYPDITKVEVFEPDAGKVVGLVLLSMAGVAATFFLALVIACNCPYVYVETPEGAQLEGELYAGAIYPQLERHDWLPLQNLHPDNGRYPITIANKLYENQHTNLLELEVIDHAPDIVPLFDKYGQMHTIAAPQAPATATNVSGADALAEVRAEDGMVFRGDLQNDRPDATERLTLTFAKPAGAKQAKLLIHARNSPWMNYVYYQFLDELGGYADKVRAQYARKSAAKNLAWMERQKLPLSVWLETTPGKWEKVDYFYDPGSIAFKRDVLPIDLSGVPGDSVRLRLEYGFNFWEIDYTALDFSPDVPVRRQTVPPLSATTQTGADVTRALAHDDAEYYDQPNIGDEALVSFAVPPQAAGQARSLILHARGHYEIHHEPAAGRPGVFQLLSWEKENALPRLSRERWREVRQLTLSK